MDLEVTMFATVGEEVRYVGYGVVNWVTAIRSQPTCSYSDVSARRRRLRTLERLVQSKLLGRNKVGDVREFPSRAVLYKVDGAVDGW